MIRISVRFDLQEHSRAQGEAEALGISVAEFVRRAVRDRLRISSDQLWMRYAGMVESGDAHFSTSIDEIVYGSKD